MIRRAPARDRSRQRIRCGATRKACAGRRVGAEKRAIPRWHDARSTTFSKAVATMSDASCNRRAFLDLERACLDSTRERTLLRAAREGDRAAQAELIATHMRLVRAVARRVTSSPTEDVIAEGVVGLVESIQRFDLSRETRLSTYAAHWIRARVQSFVLANRGIVGSPDTRASRRVFARIGRAQRALATRTHAPTPEELAGEIGVDATDVELVLVALGRDTSLDAAPELPPSSAVCRETPEDRASDAEIATQRRRVIAAALQTLPVRERRVVEARALSDDGPTLDQLATVLSLSRERVRQLEARALRRIGEALEFEGLAA
jgi:RNA polymerase sigma-32 factor